MDEPTSAFLEEIRHSRTLPPGSDALDAARAVFYAMLRAETEAGCRRLAGHLPDALETLWKPSLYRCLREQRGEDVPPPPTGFADRMRVHLPEIDDAEARGVGVAVVRALEPRLDDPDRGALTDALPEELREPLTAT